MLLLIFAVALPSLLLTWFGLVAIENEREVARRRLYETYRPVLVKAQERFDSMLADLLERSERVLDDLEALDRQEILNRVWRRRAECFERLGRKNEQQITIAALREETREATASLGFARFFPPQSDMVVQVDLAALLASPLVEKLDLKAEIDAETMQKAVGILGIDPLKDLRRVTAALALSEDKQMPVEHWLVHLECNLAGLDSRRLSQAAEKLGPGKAPATRKIHGIEVLGFELPLPEAPGKVMRVGVAALGADGVLVGDITSLELVLAARAGKAPGLAANRQLADLVAKVPANSTFWLAGVPN